MREKTTTLLMTVSNRDWSPSCSMCSKAAPVTQHCASPCNHSKQYVSAMQRRHQASEALQTNIRLIGLGDSRSLRHAMRAEKFASAKKSHPNECTSYVAQHMHHLHSHQPTGCIICHRCGFEIRSIMQLQHMMHRLHGCLKHEQLKPTCAIAVRACWALL